MKVIVTLRSGQDSESFVLDEDADLDPDAAFEAVARWGLYDDRDSVEYERENMVGQFQIDASGIAFEISVDTQDAHDG